MTGGRRGARGGDTVKMVQHIPNLTVMQWVARGRGSIPTACMQLLVLEAHCAMDEAKAASDIILSTLNDAQTGSQLHRA